MINQRFFGLLVFWGLSISAPCGEFRNWTNSEGKNVEAELMKVDGDNITLRLRNGKTTPYLQSKLTEADREYIKQQPPTDIASNPEPTEKTEKPAETPKVDAKRKAKWLTKMSRATTEAKETGLPILVLFTGTTWCPYCIKLESAVFDKKEFTTYANTNLVLLKLDYGPGGSTNNKDQKQLQTEYGVKGFPKYFLIDSSGKQLSNGGYHDGITPESFTTWVNSALSKAK